MLGRLCSWPLPCEEPMKRDNHEMTFKHIAHQVIDRMYAIKLILSTTKSKYETVMDGNMTNHTTESVATGTTVAGDYLFTTLHDNKVTIEMLLIVILVVILAVWIIILNCLLLQTLVRRHAQLEVTDIFIYSLALTDAMVGVLILYNSAYNIINFQNEYECLVRFGLIQFLLLNSSGHIGLLTIDRYVKITFPYHYMRLFHRKPILATSLFIWCGSLIIGFLPLMGWNTEFSAQHEEGQEVVCRYFGIMHPHYIMMNVSLFWIPLILMVVMYSHVCKIACRHVQEIRAQERVISRKYAGVFDSYSWRFTKTVLIIIGVYFFCWMPTGIFLMIQLSGSLHQLPLSKQGDILTLVTTAGFLNCLFNPIIYATKIPFVKKRFKLIFCCRKTKESRRNSTFAISVANSAFIQSPSD